MANPNILLGNGEVLTEPVTPPTSGGPKEHPYSLDEACMRLHPMLVEATKNIARLPDDACPEDKAVLCLILHPEYIAKSYFPAGLLNFVKLDVIGNSHAEIRPAKRSRGRRPITTTTTELYARGTRDAIADWANSLPTWSESEDVEKQQLIEIEKIFAPSVESKIEGPLPDTDKSLFEVVLHPQASNSNLNMLEDFQHYLETKKLDAEIGIHFSESGLCFLELTAPREYVQQIALFSGLRVLRPMPKMRILPSTTDALPMPDTTVELPNDSAYSHDTKIAIFDAGIPKDHPILRWASITEVDKPLTSSSTLLAHGTAVTSAALFGHIEKDAPLPRPFATVDHYSVLDESSAREGMNYYEVLGRIKSILSSHENEYDFVNFSIGPEIPIADNKIHAWSSVIDRFLARTGCLATIAVGNNGHLDSASGLNRILVPSDCINAIAVGACDSTGLLWKRAAYSPVGPGRSPGFVKPDFVYFGGTQKEPFGTLDIQQPPQLSQNTGTSFSAPSVIRLASGIRVCFGNQLSNNAIRALLVHTAEKGTNSLNEVGWGRCAQSLGEILLCDENEIRVVYQGSILPAKYIRASFPIPDDEIPGKVFLAATICFTSPIDPHFPNDYTRAGVEVVFRPHEEKFGSSKSSSPSSTLPKSESFFGPVKSDATEAELRTIASKWENCLYSQISISGKRLRNPVFDIHHISRAEGHNFKSSTPLHYALIISMRTAEYPNLYDQIVKKYEGRLRPLVLTQRIPIQRQHR